MKALDGYFLMVFFTLLLNRVHVFAIFNLVSTEKQLAVKGLKVLTGCTKDLWNKGRRTETKELIN